MIEVINPILGRPIEVAASEPERTPDAGREPASDERRRIIALLGPTPVDIDDLGVSREGARRSCGWCCGSSNWPGNSSGKPEGESPSSEI